MSLANENISPINTDGRQSLIASEIQRGVCRLLITYGYSCVTELVLAGGRRADIVALSKTGDITIVEIKSGIPDLKADNKWPDYEDHCDKFYFAVTRDFPAEKIPDKAGLIVADKYGGEIIREAAEARLAGGRRKAVTLRFARAAALRLQSLNDPAPGN